MALEALKEIKVAEEKAEFNIKDAETKAKDIIKKAHLQGDEEYNNIIAMAKEKSKDIIDNFIALANEEVAPILEQGIKEKEEILKTSEATRKKAIKLVIERIVNTHGNS